MTKAVLERALQTEMTHHLGYERDDPADIEAHLLEVPNRRARRGPRTSCPRHR